jgi:hypothetical protein
MEIPVLFYLYSYACTGIYLENLILFFVTSSPLHYIDWLSNLYTATPFMFFPRAERGSSSQFIYKSSKIMPRLTWFLAFFIVGTRRYKKPKSQVILSVTCCHQNPLFRVQVSLYFMQCLLSNSRTCIAWHFFAFQINSNFAGSVLIWPFCSNYIPCLWIFSSLWGVAFLSSAPLCGYGN